MTSERSERVDTERDGSEHDDTERAGQAFLERHKRLEQLLSDDSLEPDAERDDWQSASAPIDEAVETYQRLLEVVPEVEQSFDPEQRQELRQSVVDQGLRLLAVLKVAGQRDAAGRLVAELSSRLTSDEQGELLESAKALMPRDFVSLYHALWLLDHEQRGRARAVAREMVERSSPLAEFARSIAELPEPLDSAPGLHTLNGFGTMLYGNRDPHPDGSYVATRYLTALFLPVIPLGAYRVASAGEEGWYFLGKVPLSAAARVHRWVVPLLLVGLFAFVQLQAYLDSPSRRFAQQLEALDAERAAAAKPAQKRALVRRYEQLLQQHEGKLQAEDLRPAASTIARLLAATISEPFTLEQLDREKRVVERFGAVALRSRSGAPTSYLVGKLLRWAKQLGDSSEAKIGGASKLLDDAQRLGPSGNQYSSIVTGRKELRRQLAGKLAQAWPLEALAIYLRDLGDDKRAVVAAAKIFERLLTRADDQVWLALHSELAAFDRWRKRQGQAQLSKLAARLAQRRKDARARVAAPAYKKLLAGKDPAPLIEALGKTTAGQIPDQRLALRLATLLQNVGKTKQALQVIEKLGQPGELIRPTQAILARLYTANDRLEQADGLLERLIARRLPVFERARRAYDLAARERQKQLIAAARAGREPGLDAKLRGQDKATQRRIVDTWLTERLQRDKKLARLREAYLREAAVPRLVLQLATVKLRLARRDVAVAKKKQLLASAERLFLSIRGEAGGVPSYHLGLGQVYHRLGKRKEGERELRALLAKNDPALSLAVAEVYRDLGLEKRAGTVARRVFDTQSGQLRSQAAVKLALLAHSLEDREKWYRKADQSDPFVRTNLLQLQARRLARAGKLAAADRKFAQVAAHFERGAKSSSAGANNAALAHGERFACTGKLAHLDRAVTLLERARRLEPNSAMVALNLAELLERRLFIAILAHYVDVSRLRPNSSEAGGLIDALLHGPKRLEVQKALREDRRSRRVLDLRRHITVLAPGRIDAYSGQSRLFFRLDDLPALRKLAGQLAAVKTLDTSSTDRYLVAYRAGRYDAKFAKSARQRLATLERMVKRPAPKHTAAALQLMIGKSCLALARSASDAASARRAAQAFASARRLAPQLFELGDLELVGRLRYIVLTVRDKSPAVAAVWKRLGREASWLVLDAIAQEADARAAVVEHPQLKVAVALRKANLPKGRSELMDLTFATLAGDAAFLAQVRRELPIERLRLSMTFSRLLTPKDTSWRREKALLDSVKR
jgi:hypothetical protein